MYWVGLIALPVVLIFVLGLAVRGANRTQRVAFRALLAARGLADPLERPGAVFCLSGVIDGVGVVVEHRSKLHEPDLEVRASRDLAALFAGHAVPEAKPAYRVGAEPRVPDPVLSVAESEEAARKALSAVTKGKHTIARDGDVVRVAIEGTVLSRPLVDRAVDAALALVDQRELGPARDFLGDEPGMERIYSFGLALLAACVAAIIVPTCSAPVRSALEPWSCRSGEVLDVLVEHDHSGTGYTLFCGSRDGERNWYGCVTSFAAGFDVVFPVTYLCGLGVFVLWRKSRGNASSVT